MFKYHDLTGKRFGKLIVLRFAKREKRMIFWDCVCDCGREKLAYASNLRRGATTTCGLCKETDLERFMKNIKKTDSCWFWLGSCSSNGYGRFMMRGLKNLTAHRASYMLFKGEIPDDKCVCHSCDIKYCVNPDHLWLGTSKDNVRDRDDKGRTGWYDQSGEKNHQARITEEEAREILRLKKDKKRICEITEILQIKRGIVQSIYWGDSWQHLNSN